jgi:hypothetical protein
MPNTLKTIFFLMLLQGTASASLLDATEDLEGKVVIYAGEIEHLECPIGGKYDCSSWPTTLLKFKYKDVCFTSDIGACASLGCKGFIAAGKDKQSYLFTLESIGDDIRKYSVNYHQCPEMY